MSNKQNEKNAPKTHSEDEFDKNSRESKRSGLWSFLNSNFTIWVLSTIVVGGITYGYTEFHKANVLVAHNKALAIKMNAEIKVRLQNIDNYLLGEIGPNINDGFYFISKPQLYQDLIDTLNKGQRNSQQELSGKSFLTLLSDLKSLTLTKDTLEINQAIRGYESLVKGSIGEKVKKSFDHLQPITFPYDIRQGDIKYVWDAQHILEDTIAGRLWNN